MLSRYGTDNEKRDISLYNKIFKLINGLEEIASDEVLEKMPPEDVLGVQKTIDNCEETEAVNADSVESSGSEDIGYITEEIENVAEPKDDEAAPADATEEEVPKSLEEAIAAMDDDGPTAVFTCKKVFADVFINGRLNLDGIINAVTVTAASLCAALILFCVVINVLMARNNADKTVYISDDGIRTTHFTSASTVGEFISEAGILLGDGDELNVSNDEILKDGMFITIDRGVTVFVSSKAGVSSHSVSGGNVAKALEDIYGAAVPASVITPSNDTPVTAGMLITLDEVTKKIITSTETIPYSQVTVRDSSILRGNTEVKQEGVDGKLEVTYEVMYINGQEVSRAKISQVTALEPVDKIVHRGVKDAATPKPTAKKTSSPSKTTSKKTSNPNKTFSPSEKAELSSDKKTVTIGGKTYNIAYEYEVTATAYTHTGNKTASGKWPKVGMMAVDRSIFPFGTKAYVPGYGIAVAEDVGGFRGDQIDLFMDTYSECINWGRKRGLTIYILE